MTLSRILAACIIGTLSLLPKDAIAEDLTTQLRAIEKDRLRSLVAADLVTARRLHADDFQLVNPRGGTRPRKGIYRISSLVPWTISSASPKKSRYECTVILR